ncbi:Protein of unknown function [Gryllus bimaculatus]|nr:Protein of unknown function [Gryllus bimaculatus]
MLGPTVSLLTQAMRAAVDHLIGSSDDSLNILRGIVSRNMASEETNSQISKSKNASEDEAEYDNFYFNLKHATTQHIIQQEKLLGDVLELKLNVHNTVAELSLLETPEKKINLLSTDKLLDSHKRYLSCVSSCHSPDNTKNVDKRVEMNYT